MLVSDHAAALTIASAQNSSQLSVLKKEMNKEMNDEAVVMLAALLTETMEYVPNKLSTDQIAMYAKMILSEYWYLRIDDLILCFKNAIQGKYGTIYHAVTYVVISEWIMRYERDKDEIIIPLARQQHDQLKKSNTYEDVHPDNTEMLSELVKKWDKKSQTEQEYMAYRKQYMIDQMKKQQSNDEV